MKTSHLTAVPAAAIAMSAVLTSGNASAQVHDPIHPTGSLSAFPTIVQTGTYPTLTWSIDHPKMVADVVTRYSSGTLVPKSDIYVDIRVIGASNQLNENQWGAVQTYVKPSQSTSFTQLFSGTQDTINPLTIVYTSLEKGGLPIDFRSRDHNGSTWEVFQSTQTLTPNVIALVDGERPPSTVPAFQQNNIEPYLRPYIDPTGAVILGPLDVLYLYELQTTNPKDPKYNLQDIGVLVSFRNKSNNGHGNNIDGVDMSNPGKAPFIDTDPTLDDEKKSTTTTTTTTP